MHPLLSQQTPKNRRLCFWLFWENEHSNRSPSVRWPAFRWPTFRWLSFRWTQYGSSGKHRAASHSVYLDNFYKVPHDRRFKTPRVETGRNDNVAAFSSDEAYNPSYISPLGSPPPARSLPTCARCCHSAVTSPVHTQSISLSCGAPLGKLLKSCRNVQICLEIWCVWLFFLVLSVKWKVQ